MSASNVTEKPPEMYLPRCKSEEITIDEPLCKCNVRIDIQRCMESTSMTQILDEVPQDKVKSVKINIEIKYCD